MAAPRCPACKQGNFSLYSVTLPPGNAARSLVVCSNCGTVVGQAEVYTNHWVLQDLYRLKVAIEAIAKKMGVQVDVWGKL